MGRFGTSWENSRVKSMLHQGLMHRSNRRRYSITSSARSRSDGGTPRPSALAVLRLMTNLYLVGACIGRLASFSPLRLRSSCRLRDGTGCSYRAVALANFQVAHCLAVP